MTPAEWHDDPYFADFMDATARLLRENPKPVRIRLVDRCLRAYPQPDRHPMVRLAERAKKYHGVPVYRGRIVCKLLREEHIEMPNAKVKRILRVFDATLKNDRLDLRIALQEAKRSQLSEWTEAV